MAAKKKSTKKVVKEEVKIEETPVIEDAQEEIVEEIVEEAPVIKEKPKKSKKSEPKIIEPEQKFRIGAIVYISKDADADLNGFKLFPQYKKCTYTVEAYDQFSGVYTLRRLNLLLRLKEELIVAPEERAHDSLNRKQF